MGYVSQPGLHDSMWGLMRSEKEKISNKRSAIKGRKRTRTRKEQVGWWHQESFYEMGLKERLWKWER